MQGFENEYTDVVQNADGSYTAEIHSVPVNFRNARGAWQTIDPTLVPAAGGWRNTAGPYTVSFAGPGAPPSQDLVTISDGRRTLGFGAATPSPLAGTPIVFSNTISYPDVYPGVSLLYTLERNELKEEIVLTERPAAAPTLRFPLSLVGLAALQLPSGEIALRDAERKTVFTLPRLTMVDSSGPAGSKEGQKTDAIDYALSTVGGKQTLTISPDWAWLSDAKRVYPVSVDPVVTLAPASGSFVRSDLQTPQSGATHYEVGTSNGGGTVARTLVSFDLASLQGATVSSATLSARETWSASCSPSLVDTYRVTSSWDSSVIWSTQPTIAQTPLGSALAAQGFSASCPATRITLADVTSAVTNWLSGSWQNYGLEVKAASETDSNGFKKFTGCGKQNHGSETISPLSSTDEVRQVFASAGVVLGPKKPVRVGGCVALLGIGIDVSVFVCETEQDPKTFRVAALQLPGQEGTDREVVLGYANVVVLYRGPSLIGDRERDLRRLRNAIAALRLSHPGFGRGSAVPPVRWSRVS